VAIEDVVSRIAAIEALVERAHAAFAPARPAAAAAVPFGAALEQATAAPTSLAGTTAAASTPMPVSAPAATPVTTISDTISPEETGLVLGGPGTRTLQAVPSSDPYGLASTAGERALRAAQAEIGVREDPPGSNNGTRIAEYRTATAGSAPGVPWCAYFVSWAARNAGTPVGEQGQGYGAVAQIASWGQRTGRLLPAGTTPAPGDLILFGSRHIGIVESVAPDGRLTTVEGNHQNSVQRVGRTIGDATGFVRLS